jgi:hypothetical protein
MAYEDLMNQGSPANIRDIYEQQQSRAVDSFFTNLLHYGLESTTTPMPDKSQLWNEFVALKKGRLTQDDLLQFEQNYSRVKTANYQKQIQSYDRLGYEGKSLKSIQKDIADDPVEYKNLIDMISDLDIKIQQGDETALAAKSKAMAYLPETKTMAEEYLEDPGLIGGFAPYAALGGGAALYNVLSKPTTASLDARAAAKTSIKDAKSKLPGARKDVKSTQKKLKAQEKSLKDHQAKKSNKKTIEKAKQHVEDSKQKLKENRQTVRDLNKASKAPVPKTETRLKSFAGKAGTTGLPGQILGIGALSQLPKAGEMIGGDPGESVGEDIRDASLIGWGLGSGKTPGVGNRLAALYMLASGGYSLANKYFPEQVNALSKQMSNVRDYWTRDWEKTEDTERPYKAR